MTITEFIKKAITVSFKEKGRDFTGWDCWGCVKSFFWEVHGIVLPDYQEYTSTKEYDRLSEIFQTGRSGWQAVTEPRQGDVIAFRISGRPCHVGIVLGKGRFLHCEEKINTVIELWPSSIWKKRIEGFYRYAGTS